MFNSTDTTFYNLPFKLDYKYIKTTEEAFKTFEYFDKFDVVAVDTETTGLDPFEDKIILLQLALPNGKVFVYDMRYIPGELFRVILEDDRLLHIFQNVVYDYSMIKTNYNISVKRIYDTMIAERCITLGLNSPANLRHLVYKYLNYQIEKNVATEFCSGYIGELTNRQIQYAAHDAACLFGIAKTQGPTISNQGLNRVCKLEFEFAPCMADMELAGILLDTDKWRLLIEDTESKLNKLTGDILPVLAPGINQQGLFGAPAINLASNAQVLSCLTNLGLQLEDTSVGSLTKVKRAHPAIPLMLEYRQFEKLLNSFGETILRKINPKTGRLHPSYKQMVRTGRLSCSNPNLQQMPGIDAFRSCFIAKPGYDMVTSDMSQAELRILACLSKDPVFIETYKNNGDIHTATACDVYSLTEEEVIADKNLSDNDPNKKDYRKSTKSINFGLIYGMSKYGLAARLEISEEKAEEMIDAYFKAYPRVKSYLDGTAESAINKCYSTTISGRRRYYTLPDPNMDKKERNGILNHIRRCGKNTGIQGCFVSNTNIFGAGFIGDNVGKQRILSCGKDGSIVAVGKYSGEQKVYKLTTDMGFTLTGTFNHQMVVKNGRYDSNPMCALGETLGKSVRMFTGKYEGFPVSIGEVIGRFRLITKNNYITKELGFILGCLYDSGYFESRQKLFYIKNKVITKNLIDSFTKYFRSFGNVSKNSPIEFVNKGSKIFISFNSGVKKLLYYMLHNKAGKIGYMEAILNSPVEIREAFVSGFLGCRSRVSKDKQDLFILCSNDTVAFTIQQLLLSVGVMSFKEEGVNGDYQLSILNDFVTNAGNFIDEFGLGLNTYITMPESEFYDVVKSIDYVGIKNTYDFVSDDEPHMYIANGFKVSNSNADVLKQSIVNLSNNIKEKEYDADIVLNVHDEIVVESRKDQSEEISKVLSKSIIDAWDSFFTTVPMLAGSNIDYCWNK